MLSFTITDEATVSSQPLLRRQWLAVVGGLCAQTGALAASLGHLILAAMLVLGSSVLWTLLFANYSGLSRQQTWRRILTSTVSVLLTTGLLLLLQASRGFGAFGIRFGHHSARAFGHEPKGGHSGREASGNPFLDVHDAYAGIVLWPKKQTYTKLIAPAPISFQQKLFRRGHSNSFIIPFDGVYWFYKASDARPPTRSRQAHGSPEMFDIRSTDLRPLSMEAHQNLGTVINLNCCSRIQIAIRNADRYPESVSLELFLVDTTSPGKPSQSLGRQNVNSTRPWKLYNDRPPTAETLNFAIPSGFAIHGFDEVKVVFRLDADRADAGAKIGIDHFTLVPRGL